ncbi:MAG: HEPN domain-containing protein [Sulfolobales archaeon]
MSYNPLDEARYRYRLALEHLKRAERLFSLGDWAGTVSASQLAVENFAKTIIAVFEIPTWSHDPSGQLNRLIERLPAGARSEARELATLARELAPEHGRSSYGEPSAGLLPSDIYKEEHALDALEKCRRAKVMTERIIEMLNIRF